VGPHRLNETFQLRVAMHGSRAPLLGRGGVTSAAPGDVRLILG